MHPEAIPILCAKCGGSAFGVPEETHRCRYCGHEESLPPDIRDRMRLLRARVDDVARRTAQVSGLSIAYVRIFEGEATPFWILFLWFGLGSLLAPVGIGPALLVRPSGVVGIFVFSVIVAGCFAFYCIGAGMLFGLRRGRRAYSAVLRPLLVARPPALPGAPVGCRVCGAPLPDSMGATRVCRHCNSVSVLGERQAVPEAQRLDLVARIQRESLGGALGTAAWIARDMRRATWIGTFVMLGASFAFAAILLTLLALL